MRIKKFTSLFLAILLLCSNFGIAINVHYCGDKIASLSSTFALLSIQKNNTSYKKSCCCLVVKEKKDSCCKDKLLDLKKDTKDVVVKTFSFQVDAALPLVKLNESIIADGRKNLGQRGVTAYCCSPNAPPLFKLYKQYIFYA